MADKQDGVQQPATQDEVRRGEDMTPPHGDKLPRDSQENKSRSKQQGDRK